MGPVLLTTFINDLKQMAGCTLTRCEVTTNWWEQLMHLREELPPKGIQDGLEEQVSSNVMKFNKNQCKVLPWGRKSCLQQHRWACQTGEQFSSSGELVVLVAMS